MTSVADWFQVFLPSGAMALLPRRTGLYAPEETENAQRQVVWKKSVQYLLASLNIPVESDHQRRLTLRRTFSPVPAVWFAEVPISEDTLLHLVQKRLEVGPEWAHIPSKPQVTFRDIILREVRQAFKDLQRSLHQPAFRAQKNRRMYQNLVAYIVVVCQYLFRHYLCLLEQRGLLKVFTDHANFTRFSAQLTLDCSTFLNMTAVRHRLVIEMKTVPSLWPETPFKELPSLPHMSKERLGSRLGFCIGYFLRLARPRLPTERNKVAEDIKELQSLPSLDMGKIRRLHLPTQQEIALRKQMLHETPRKLCICCSKKNELQQVKKAKSPTVRRTQSLPNMRAGQLLADQLGIRIPRRPLSPDLPCYYVETSEDERGKFHHLLEDLQRLLQGRVVKHGPWQGGGPKDDLELPPLINVLTRRKANEIHQQKLQRTLLALQEEESAKQKRRDTIIAAPSSHPQATTIDFKVNDRMVVKVADVQVSERVFLEDVSLERLPPIYNHLLGEIDNATVELLDATISPGEEIREIYKELATTIPEDHMKLDAGPLIEFSPGFKMDPFLCFASSMLTRRKGEQIINPELSNILPAGPYCPEEVIDSLQTTNLPCKKITKKKFASWLKWWKKTFNTDDYLKYVSTTESDYLAVIFHLYDTEKEEEEEEEERLQRPALIQVELEMKKQEEVVTMEAVQQAPELPAKKDKCENLLEEETLEIGDQESEHVKLWHVEAETLGPSEYKPKDLKLLQRRLERLWVVLHFSEPERLAMALKYSSHPSYLLLPDVLQAWEVAAQSIQEREILLAELEKFEWAASDPNRLFSLDLNAYSKRGREGRTRKCFHSELALCNSELYLILTHIKEAYGDTVTFKGRPYLEKMEWDMVEMVYWLQQERRADPLSKAIQKSRRLRKLPPLG